MGKASKERNFNKYTTQEKKHAYVSFFLKEKLCSQEKTITQKQMFRQKTKTCNHFYKKIIETMKKLIYLHKKI